MSAGERAEMEQGVDTWAWAVGELLELSPTDENKKLVQAKVERLLDAITYRKAAEERRISASIQRDTDEIAKLQERLEGTTPQDDAGGGHRHSGGKWGLIKSYRNLNKTTWDFVYKNLMSGPKADPAQFGRDIISVLQLCYDLSRKRIDLARSNIEKAVLHPGEDLARVKTVRADEEVHKAALTCQVATSQHGLPLIQQHMLEEVLQHKHFPTKNKPEEQVKALRHFTHKAVAVCWVMALEHPSLKMVDNPAKQCKPLLKEHEFEKHKQVGKTVFVAWPALVDVAEYLVLVPWELMSKDKQAWQQLLPKPADSAIPDLADSLETGHPLPSPQQDEPAQVKPATPEPANMQQQQEAKDTGLKTADDKTKGEQKPTMSKIADDKTKGDKSMEKKPTTGMSKIVDDKPKGDKTVEKKYPVSKPADTKTKVSVQPTGFTSKSKNTGKNQTDQTPAGMDF